MTKKDFIKKIKIDCKDNGVEFIVGKGNQMKHFDSENVCGYFSDSPPTLAYASGHKDSFEILLHESSHMDQWLDKMDLWKIIDVKNDDEIMDDFLNGTSKYTQRKINNSIDRIQQLEIDCEKRAVKKIEEYELPIDAKKYIKKANSYILFYTLIKETKKWYKTPPYRIAKLFNAMPDYFLSDYSNIPSEMIEFYEYCY